jgi:hypothetical protein
MSDLRHEMTDVFFTGVLLLPGEQSSYAKDIVHVCALNLRDPVTDVNTLFSKLGGATMSFNVALSVLIGYPLSIISSSN